MDHKAADVQGNLLFDDAFLGVAKCHVCILGLRLVVQGGRFALFYGGVTTLDGGSTRWTVEFLNGFHISITAIESVGSSWAPTAGKTDPYSLRTDPDLQTRSDADGLGH